MVEIVIEEEGNWHKRNRQSGLERECLARYSGSDGADEEIPA